MGRAYPHPPHTTSTAAPDTAPADVPRYIVFLRAVNVGGRTLKMDYLRELLAALRLRNVETFIASGNAGFESDDGDATTLESRIERGLAASLRYDMHAFIRSPEEIAAVATHALPWSDPGESLHVGFLKSPPTDEGIARLMKLATPTDDFHVHGREFWWRALTKVSQSKVTGSAIEKALGLATTMRSITTVRRASVKYPVRS